MYCDIIISMAPKMEAHGVINLKALPFCSVNIIIIIFFAVSRWCLPVSSRVRGII